MRNTFINGLVQQASLNHRIALIVGDLGYSVVEPFAKKFPERFINAGVAEQNMMGIAAGMASEGYHVFVYSIANFPTFRCAEQIRNDVAYHNLPVTVVTVGGGLSYGNLGYSHHALQDYALVRVMPNMLIAAPGDPIEVSACLGYLCRNPQPSYFRIGKSGEPNLHEGEIDISPGFWLKVGTGQSRGTTKKAILTTGTTLALARSILKQAGKIDDYDLFSMPLWSMADKKNQAIQVKNYQEVITLEDHLVDGGFGSWMLESIAQYGPDLVDRIKIRGLADNVCGRVGSQDELNAFGGLTQEGIFQSSVY